MLTLSPLNLSSLIANLRENEAGESVVVGKKRKSAREIVKWACPICGDTYDELEEDLAENCCQGKDADSDQPVCPVCNTEAEHHRAAADCCLWKDLDAPTRWKVADAVEAGSTWADELGVAYQRRINNGS